MFRTAHRQLDPLFPGFLYSSSHSRCLVTQSRPPHTRSFIQQDDDPRLPRHLRRQAQFGGRSTSDATRPEQITIPSRPSTSSFNHQSRYRSRHYDPSKDKGKDPEIKLLEPHVLSARLKKLCEVNKIDAAVELLKNSPLDAQNTPVWNTLIWECMKATRYKLAYQLFIDMKRRGFSPTTRTFKTMLSGLSRIEDWNAHEKQLQNARSIYDAFRRHIEAVAREDPTSPDLDVDPLAAFIKILGDAGRFQEVFIVYHSLDPNGPMAPNKFVFTAMFHAIAGKNSSTKQVWTQAADVRFLWKEMLKASERLGFSVDAILVTAAVTAVSRPRSTVEKVFAFDLLQEYFGLTALGEPPVAGKLPLSPQALGQALTFCNNALKASECVHFFQQVIKRPERIGGVEIIDRGHVEEVLKARLTLVAPGSAHLSLETLEWMLRQEITGPNGPKVRPGIGTFNLVLTTCWRGADWNSATRTFNLMTGYRCHDFMDGSMSGVPRRDQRPQGRNLNPTAETLSCMLRTALVTQSLANMRQSLRLVAHVGSDFLTSQPERQMSRKADKNQLFHLSKFAAALVETIDQVLDSASGARPGEREQWTALHDQAKQMLKIAPAEPEFFPRAVPEPPKEKVERLTKYELSLRSQA